ncbi:hypothetical protein Tco_0731087 [Tanacetum coccineum]
MSTSYITISSDSEDDSTGSSISYIILSDLEAVDTALPTTSLAYQLTMFRLRQTMSQLQTLRLSRLRYQHHLTMHREHLEKEDESLSTQDPPTPPTQTSPTIPTSIIEPALIPSFPPYRLHPSRPCFMFTPRKTVWAPYTLPPAIEAAIFDEISAPPFKRTRSPSPPPPPPSPSSPSSSSSSPSSPP